MTRINFKNLPDKTTPINADNLNKLNNLAIDTEVGEHEEEVVLIESDNLLKIARASGFYTGAGTKFNEKQYFVNMAYDGGVGSGISVTNIGINSISVKGQYIQGVGLPVKCEPDTEYSLVCTATDSNARIGYSFYTEDGTYISGNAGGVGTYTFTTPSNAYWLVSLFLVAGGNLITETFSNIILNKGNTITAKVNKPKQIYANKEKYTDTVNIGTEPNNAGVLVNVSKNLWSGANLANHTIDSSGVIKTTQDNSLFYIPVKYGESYTFSYTGSTSGNIVYGYTNSIPAVNVSCTYNILDIVSLNGHTFTPVNSNNKYLCIRLNTSANNQYKAMSSIMVNVGSVVLAYEPYVNPNIKAYINGEYQTIARNNVYSTGEVVIGEWLGKPLYRKVVNVGALPNATYTSIAHNISNLDYVCRAYGSAIRTSDKTTLPIPYSGSSNTIELYINQQNINITTSGNRSAFNGYITLEYTKTTDTGVSLLSLDE